MLDYGVKNSGRTKGTESASVDIAQLPWPVIHVYWSRKVREHMVCGSST